MTDRGEIETALDQIGHPAEALRTKEKASRSLDGKIKEHRMDEESDDK